MPPRPAAPARLLAGFFKRQAEPPNRVPHRAGAEHDPVFGQQPHLRLRQCYPRLRADVRRQRKFLCRRALARGGAAVVRADPGIAGLPPPDQRLVDVGDADLEDHWRLATRHPAFHRRQHPIAQILRVTLPRSPPPS